jgi:hypothetical protein
LIACKNNTQARRKYTTEKNIVCVFVFEKKIQTMAELVTNECR